jgi:alpha-tubulin suppressor-like RCC1 family protein
MVLKGTILPSVATLLITFGAFTTGAGDVGATSTTVTHWGAFFGGDTHDQLLSPTAISLPGRVVTVASSNSDEYALLANGSVYAWGLGSEGELGNGGTVDSLTVPVRVAFPAGVKIATLPTDVMPYDTALAIDTTGQAWGWGYNEAGELCLGNTASQLVPTRLPFVNVTAIAGAGGHASYESNGVLLACGGNAGGVLGDGSTVSSTTPVTVKALNGRKVRALVSSFDNSGALLADGEYFDWGYDAQGQLGDGELGMNSAIPVEVKLPFPVKQVVQGGSFTNNGQTLVMLSDGSLRAWGNDESGQLGDQGTLNQPSPIVFDPPVGVTYKLLATGGGTSYAVSTVGNLYSWGSGGSGQIGNGGTATEFTPQLIGAGVGQISSTANNVVARP